ncbi:MAG: 16S rRNA (cytosine(1402)-N(4))-methyltransferase RsmH [Bacilli bacterium]|nr:16S rRNA (cytosine(1402)-N(4))-methyltransferase RsmH [Bacilli bacterium]
MKNNYSHKSVLLEEVISGLNLKEDGLYVDCTMGGAGHSLEILKKVNKGHLCCFDQDTDCIEIARKKLSSIGENFTIVKDNFRNIKKRLLELGIEKVDGVLYDLGVSSYQFDTPERGFSYNYDSYLDMRMDQENNLTAYDVVNSYDYDKLCDIFYKYGEEKFSSSIAKNIVRQREIKKIETTFELVEVIKKSIPAAVKRKEGHPAKKIFQAIRIEVNDELKAFEQSLKDSITMLEKGGRIAVISFHSLEDRICKTIFKEKVEVVIPKNVPILDKDIKREFRLVSKKPIIASEVELNLNNRAHSAKLRILEKIKQEV